MLYHQSRRENNRLVLLVSVLLLAGLLVGICLWVLADGQPAVAKWNGSFETNGSALSGVLQHTEATTVTVYLPMVLRAYP